MRATALIVGLALALGAVWTAAPVVGQRNNEDHEHAMSPPRTLLRTSIARRMNTTGDVSVGMETDNRMMITVNVRNGHRNAPYAMWLVNGQNTMRLGETRNTGGNGNVRLTWTGRANPGSYTDLAVYYLPAADSRPRAGAIRMLSLPARQLESELRRAQQQGQQQARPG